LENSLETSCFSQRLPTFDAFLPFLPLLGKLHGVEGASITLQVELKTSIPDEKNKLSSSLQLDGVKRKGCRWTASFGHSLGSRKGLLTTG